MPADVESPNKKRENATDDLNDDDSLLPADVTCAVTALAICIMSKYQYVTCGMRVITAGDES